VRLTTLLTSRQCHRPTLTPPRRLAFSLHRAALGQPTPCVLLRELAQNDRPVMQCQGLHPDALEILIATHTVCEQPLDHARPQTARTL